jgi:hypothetical protein
MQNFRLAMRSTIIGAFGVGAILMALPVLAQGVEPQVTQVVEALRQASKPQKSTGLLSDWQVKPGNVKRWSKYCLGKEVTPAQFQSSQSTARSIVTCVVRDVFKQEYRVSGNNETIAVQRVAAWWLTGDGRQFKNPNATPFIQKVVSFYKPVGTTEKKKPSTPETTTSTQIQDAFYDRYMRAGYAAIQRRDRQAAVLYFRRALDERPEDKFALQAIRNAEDPKRATTPKTNERPKPRR